MVAVVWCGVRGGQCDLHYQLQQFRIDQQHFSKCRALLPSTPFADFVQVRCPPPLTDFVRVGLCPSLCNNGFLEHRRLVHRPAALAACAALAGLAADGVNVLDLQYMSLPSIARSAEQFRTLQTVLLGRVASRQMRAVLLLCSLSNSTRYK